MAAEITFKTTGDVANEIFRLVTKLESGAQVDQIAFSRWDHPVTRTAKGVSVRCGEVRFEVLLIQGVKGAELWWADATGEIQIASDDHLLAEVENTLTLGTDPRQSMQTCADWEQAAFEQEARETYREGCEEPLRFGGSNLRWHGKVRGWFAHNPQTCGEAFAATIDEAVVAAAKGSYRH